MLQAWDRGLNVKPGPQKQRSTSDRTTAGDAVCVAPTSISAASYATKDRLFAVLLCRECNNWLSYDRPSLVRVASPTTDATTHSFPAKHSPLQRTHCCSSGVPVFNGRFFSQDLGQELITDPLVAHDNIVAVGIIDGAHDSPKVLLSRLVSCEPCEITCGTLQVHCSVAC